MIELTESAIVDDPPLAAEVLGAIRTLGSRVAIDDFGSGYSSLAYLRQIPADILEIDRSLVADLETDHRSVQLLQGIVTLAHDIGMRVTVQGIETEQQLAIVRAAGCHVIQGFIVSVPASSRPCPGCWPRCRRCCALERPGGRRRRRSARCLRRRVRHAAGQ